jgi:hypothetical protein
VKAAGPQAKIAVSGDGTGSCPGPARCCRRGRCGERHRPWTSAAMGRWCRGLRCMIQGRSSPIWRGPERVLPGWCRDAPRAAGVVRPAGLRPVSAPAGHPLWPGDAPTALKASRGARAAARNRVRGRRRAARLALARLPATRGGGSVTIRDSGASSAPLTCTNPVLRLHPARRPTAMHRARAVTRPAYGCSELSGLNATLRLSRVHDLQKTGQGRKVNVSYITRSRAAKAGLEGGASDQILSVK